MKKMTSFKSMVVSMVFLAGVGIGSASAQTVCQSDSVTPAVSTSSAPSAVARTQAHRDVQSGVVLRGGYNVGRTSTQNVPGCQGPASFCNLYFGN